MTKLRPKQQEVLAYTGGRMGVSAVPGSGKTFVLSALAARIVSSGALADDQEVLIVTLVNSAVDNFANRVKQLMGERSLLPIGFRVRTLHGLAHDILRERPALVGLADDFQIATEPDTAQMLKDAAEAWVAAHPEAAGDFIDPAIDERKSEWVRREQWPGIAVEAGGQFIRMAKDLQLTPEVLRERLAGPGESSALLDMGLAIYADYQRALSYRGAIDYDDLIRLALAALRADPDFLLRLRHRWPFILEDEAQDSSRLQEQILHLLSGEGGNWVRVGDPNQAIYETFTTASPKYLRNFLSDDGVAARELPNSGRSTPAIIALANELVRWSREEHPVPGLRDALAPTTIEPTPPDDPQPNPSDVEGIVRLVNQSFTPDAELAGIVSSICNWLPQNQDKTVAILAPRNERGEAVVAALRQRGIELVELLRSTRSTRETAGALANVLAYLGQPSSPVKLATTYSVWRRADRDDPELRPRVEAVGAILRRAARIEEYIWPRPDGERLDGLQFTDPEGLFEPQLRDFRAIVRRWQAAVALPIDQLLLTIGADLFTRPSDLALTYKLAGALRQAQESHPHWRLLELTNELAVIARNERKFLGVAEDDTGFDPNVHKGKVVVATVHKAKGLEWDRVYLMSINNYDYPSAQAADRFIAEKWFVRDNLNLPAEALAQLVAVAGGEALPDWGVASEQARLDYAAERLRLLYVGITRARKDLIVTYNTGRDARDKIHAAAPLIALQNWQRAVQP
jgi:DNA helicase II / ATP-dependent DNA helicase PcrA